MSGDILFARERDLVQIWGIAAEAGSIQPEVQVVLGSTTERGPVVTGPPFSRQALLTWYGPF